MNTTNLKILKLKISDLSHTAYYDDSAAIFDIKGGT
jgi:hypothetical protein